jgi:hypothetical protein
LSQGILGVGVVGGGLCFALLCFVSDGIEELVKLMIRTTSGRYHLPNSAVAMF